MANTVVLMVSRVGPKWFASNSNGVIGPISDTIKTTVAATEIENKYMKGSVDSHAKADFSVFLQGRIRIRISSRIHETLEKKETLQYSNFEFMQSADYFTCKLLGWFIKT